MGTIAAEFAGADGAGAAKDLCRRLIRVDREVTLKQAQVAGAWMGVKVVASVFEAVQREVDGADSIPPGPVRDDPVVSEEAGGSTGSGGRELGQERSGSASMQFMVDFLKSHPEASYHDVKQASEAEGHRVVPVTFGNARRLAGLPKRTARSLQAPAERGTDVDHAEPAPRTRAARLQERPPRATPRPVNAPLDDLVEMVRCFQDSLGDLRETLLRIHDVAQECLERTR